MSLLKYASISVYALAVYWCAILLDSGEQSDGIKCKGESGDW